MQNFSLDQLPDSASRRSTLTAVELSFARALDIHTAAICAGGSRPDLCSQLAVAAAGGANASKMPEQHGVADLWSLVEAMCQVESFGVTGDGSVLETRCSRRMQVRHFHELYFFSPSFKSNILLRFYLVSCMNTFLQWS